MSITAETGQGRLRGVQDEDALKFLGIPYAVAPRFAPPRPAEPWSGVREATRFGPAAPQPARPVNTFAHGDLPRTGEQCLHLNVYTPSLEGRRPVLVWLHGGGFAMGHAGSSIYRATWLAVEADAVVVTLNYRLGSLGWLFHPSLRSSEGAPAGNWGLLDQIAALRWVHDHVAAFGGDPEQVTLAGQSAGALCALDLLVSPEAAGLFRRIIAQSPPMGDLAGPAERAIRWAEDLSALAGGAGFDAALLNSLPADGVVALHEALLEKPGWRGTRGGALPTVDPALLPRSPLHNPGAAADVDVLIGNTGDEGTFFFRAPWRPPPDPAAVPGLIAHLPGVEDVQETLELHGARARARGESGDPLSLLVAAATDALVAGPAARWAETRAAAGGRVYRYRVDHQGAGPVLGATHTAEVPLLFGTWRDGGPGQRLGGQARGADEVARAMTRAWSRFIHGQDPGWNALNPLHAEIEIGVFGGAALWHAEHRGATHEQATENVQP